MVNFRIVKGGLAAVVAVGLMALAPASANAATWYKTAGTTQYGYSWNSYKTTVYPSAYPTAPSGYKAYSKKVTIKTTSGATLATKVSSSVRGPGTYKAYSYFTYRKQVPHTAYKTVSTSSSDVWAFSFSVCRVTSVRTVDDWPVYTLKCTGEVEEMDSKTYPATWPAVEWSAYYDTLTYSVGSTLTDNDTYNVWMYAGDATGTYIKRYTAYTNYYAYKNTWRYATVKKVVNYATVTKLEYDTVQVRDTLARVRSVFGSAGKLIYQSSYLGDEYQWTNTSGGPVYVWIVRGYVDDKSTWW